MKFWPHHIWWRIVASIMGAMVFGTVCVWLFWTPGPHVARDPLLLPARDSVTLFMTADEGLGEKDQWAVAKMMEERCVARGGIGALLLAGDLVYQNGVSSVDDPQWETKGIGPYRKPCLAKSPMVAVLGNHDYNGHAAAVLDKAKTEPRWIMPARNYEVRFGDLIQLVAMDSDRPDWCGMPDRCMWDFARERLSLPFSGWRFVMAHHFLDGSGSHHPTAGFYGFFGKWALCGKMDAYLSGHSHHLEHMRIPGCGGEQFIFGGGGAALQGLRDKHAAGSLFALRDYGFLEAVVSRDRIVWTFYAVGRGAVYSVVTTKLERR